ncbi:MAG: histidine kinase [Rhodothermales bacterium]|nr:histidine kinase [Rhodothermales bacterium]
MSRIASSFVLYPRPRALPIFAVWYGVWAVFMAHDVLATAAAGRTPLETEHFAWNFVAVNLWALATPLLIGLVRRYPVEGAAALRHALVHLGAAVALSLTTTTAYAGLRSTYVRLFEAPPEAAWTSGLVETFGLLLLRSIVFDLLFYTAAVAVLHALVSQRRLREREVREAQLETQLARAQVEALRMQLNPHFLFNTLHAISSLMDDDVRKARRMLVDLSDLLRLSLDSVGEQEVPLEQELAFLERYLDIERVRFEDRLAVEVDVDDGALAALVPTLVLQPLVENALKHAIAPFARGGRVTVRAHREGDVLRLAVEDDGPGLAADPAGAPAGDGAPAARTRQGVGLRNTRERLARLYGGRHRFHLDSPPGRGLTVELELPFHTTPALATP